MAQSASMIRGIPFNIEPKRENRFIIEFPTELGIEVWKVQKIKKPQLTINSVPIHYMNQENYVAGKYNWEPMDMTFIDTIGPSTSTQLMEWVRLEAESLTGREGYAAGYKKTLILKQLDPTGVVVDKWTLEECMITSVDFGQNDHESDAVAMVDVTIQPWRCIHNY
ncbi:MAG: hypothetical protein ACOCVF_00605 [bacterium]